MMIALNLTQSARATVDGVSYAVMSEPDKLNSSLVRLSKHNADRLSSLAPTETNRFHSMFFLPLLNEIRDLRAQSKGKKINKLYVSQVLDDILDRGLRYATVAEVCTRVSSSVKEADAFMSTITANAPLLTPFKLEPGDPDKPESAINLKLYAKLASKTISKEAAKQVVDSIVFPSTGIGALTDSWSIPNILARFIAKPGRPLTRTETTQMVDEVIAFYVLADEIASTDLEGSTNAALALHIILDAFISAMLPDSTSSTVMQQELSGQASVVTLDVIRRITGSFGTLALTAYLSVPTLRMLHMTELAERTAEVTKKHIPSSDIAFISTTQTLDLLKQVNQMTVPYLVQLHALAGSEDSLVSSDLFPDDCGFLPPAFQALIGDIPKQDMIEAITGVLPVAAHTPIRIKQLSRSDHFKLASDLEGMMTGYRSHVMSFNVILSQYFKNAETGLLPANLPDANGVLGKASVSMAYAQPFDLPASIRPVKYDDKNKWSLADYINKPHNLYDLIQKIIANQPCRFLFDEDGSKLPALGGTQGGRFLSMPIPGCYAAFTEQYAMTADLTTFLDLIGLQAKITTRDKFFEDLSLLLLFARGTDDFIHLYRAIAPYFHVTIVVKADKSKKDVSAELLSDLEKSLSLTDLDKVLMAWGLPIAMLNTKQKAEGFKALNSSISPSVIDPLTGAVATFNFFLRNIFPAPTPLTTIRVDKFSKSVLMQPVSKEWLKKLDLPEDLSTQNEDALLSPVRSISSYLLDEANQGDLTDVKNIKWLSNSSFYHKTAAAPHMRLSTSLTFSEAFGFLPSDVKSMLSTSLIVSDDAEGFTQIFSLMKVNAVMIEREDEEANSFPSTNRGQESPSVIAPAMTSGGSSVVIDLHTNEGKGLKPEDDTPNPTPTADLLDNSGDEVSVGITPDIPAGDLVENIQPEAKVHTDGTIESNESVEKKKKSKAEKQAKRAEKQSRVQKNTLLPSPTPPSTTTAPAESDKDATE